MEEKGNIATLNYFI